MLVLQSLIFGLIICLLSFYANFRWRRRRLYELAAKLPGPRGLPLIGVAHKFINTDFKKIFQILMTITKGHESPAAVWLGPELVVFAETPEALQVVLNSPKCLDKSPLYDVLIVTKGLLVGSGDIWRTHRKILNPAFSIKILQPLIPLFDEKSKIFIKNLKAKVGKAEFDIYVYMSNCSLETLLKGTLEMDRDIQSSSKQSDYIVNIEVGAHILMKKMLNFFYNIKPIYRMTSLYQLEKKHVHNGILKIADEAYDEKKLKSQSSSQNDSNEEDGYDEHWRKPKNFIDTLLDVKNGLSKEEIKDEINTLVAAGHETSALMISFALLMLGMHPEVQEKVVDELREVFEDADTAIDYNSLGKLTYLEMILKETMRLFPVVPVSARKSSGEFQIGNYTIPAGATIAVSSFNVQRNKKYWGDDADEFRPERFEPENIKKVPFYAYIPFTGGPRICIGWRYGMLFMKSVLANFLRKYETSTTLKMEDLEFELILTIKIAQKCMISLKERKF